MTATNVATGVETSRKTTDAGFFVLPLLPAGEYSVTVKASGFQSLTQQHIVLDALQTLGLNLQLQLGTANETVTVSSAPSVLKTDDVALGSSMQNNVYDALPLAMNGSARDPSAFAGLAVGVSTYSTQAAGPSTGSFNGGQTYQNEVYIEGLPLTSAGTESDTRNLAFGVSVEAVDQFQVETSGAKAMYEGQGVRITFSNRGPISSTAASSNISAIPISTPGGSSPSLLRSSIKTNSAPVSAGPSRRINCSSSAITMGTVSIPPRLPAINPYRQQPSDPAISALSRS